VREVRKDRPEFIPVHEDLTAPRRNGNGRLRRFARVHVWCDPSLLEPKRAKRMFRSMGSDVDVVPVVSSHGAEKEHDQATTI
jgi:hypothetical protein